MSPKAATKIVIPAPLNQPHATDTSDLVHPTLEDVKEADRIIHIRYDLDAPPDEEEGASPNLEDAVDSDPNRRHRLTQPLNDS